MLQRGSPTWRSQRGTGTAPRSAKRSSHGLGRSSATRFDRSHAGVRSTDRPGRPRPHRLRSRCVHLSRALRRLRSCSGLGGEGGSSDVRSERSSPSAAWQSPATDPRHGRQLRQHGLPKQPASRVPSSGRIHRLPLHTRRRLPLETGARPGHPGRTGALGDRCGSSVALREVPQSRRLTVMGRSAPVRAGRGDAGGHCGPERGPGSSADDASDGPAGGSAATGGCRVGRSARRPPRSRRPSRRGRRGRPAG